MNAFEISVPADRLRILQIVTIALSMGASILVAIFVGITLSQGKNITSNLGMLEIVVVLQAFLFLPVAFFLPKQLARRTVGSQFGNVNLEAEVLKESGDSTAPKKFTNGIMDILQSSTIVACALVEGVALFGAVVFYLNQSLYPLAIGIFCCLILFTRIPTESRIQNQIKDLFDATQTH